MVISSLPHDTLTSLTTSSVTSPADQLSAEILFYYMARYQLTRFVGYIFQSKMEGLKIKCWSYH